MEKKFQIFISSTYLDLIEERQTVLNHILSMQHIPVGMELFCADDKDQWSIIQNTIDLSDYYILIIGHRYGSVFKEGEDKGISFTEKEFLYATKKGIPILVFIIDNNTPVTPDKFEKDVVKRRKLELFKEKASMNRQTKWWKNKDDLARLINTALVNQFKTNERLGWTRATGVILKDLDFLYLNKIANLLRKPDSMAEADLQLRTIARILWAYNRLTEADIIYEYALEIKDSYIVRYERAELRDAMGYDKWAKADRDIADEII